MVSSHSPASFSARVTLPAASSITLTIALRLRRCSSATQLVRGRGGRSLRWKGERGSEKSTTSLVLIVAKLCSMHANKVEITESVLVVRLSRGGYDRKGVLGPIGCGDETEKRRRVHTCLYWSIQGCGAWSRAYSGCPRVGLLPTCTAWTHSDGHGADAAITITVIMPVRSPSSPPSHLAPTISICDGEGWAKMCVCEGVCVCVCVDTCSPGKAGIGRAAWWCPQCPCRPWDPMRSAWHGCG